MKYKVLAAGLYHGDDFFAFGEGFPASLKGFDYGEALERKLIEENKDGVVSDGKPEKSDSKRVQESATHGNASPARDGER